MKLPTKEELWADVTRLDCPPGESLAAGTHRVVKKYTALAEREALEQAAGIAHDEERGCDRLADRSPIGSEPWKLHKARAGACRLVNLAIRALLPASPATASCTGCEDRIADSDYHSCVPSEPGSDVNVTQKMGRGAPAHEQAAAQPKRKLPIVCSLCGAEWSKDHGCAATTAQPIPTDSSENYPRGLTEADVRRIANEVARKLWQGEIDALTERVDKFVSGSAALLKEQKSAPAGEEEK